MNLRKWPMNIAGWRVAVIFAGVMSLSLNFVIAYDRGGMENVLSVLMISAPGMVCVVGVYFFFRSKLLKAYKLLETQRREGHL